MRIVTDFPRFPQSWKTKDAAGTSRSFPLGGHFRRIPKIFSELRQADLLIVHESPFSFLWLIVFFALIPFLKKPIISVDIILQKPSGAKGAVSAWFKKQFLKRIDHFIHYFRDLKGYESYYGISPGRSSYVPFKANLFGHPKLLEAAAQAGEYVYMAGQSLRDFDCFIEAVRTLPYPAAVPKPDFSRLRRHGARYGLLLQDLPPNVRLLDDDGSTDAWLRNMSKARLVVIPILKDSLRAAGISVYLDAMLLKKCVVISHGPGVSELLRDEAIMVPPEDPAALREAIRRVWQDPVLREDVASRGHRYALALGSEPELMGRVLDGAVSWYCRRGLNPAS